MPELPDLEVFANTLQNKLANQQLKGVKLHQNRKANVSEREFADTLVGHHLKSVYREGKELRFAFAGGNILGMHLMLHGQLLLTECGDDVKFPILQLDFTEQTLWLTDWQKSATPTLNPMQNDVPDALDEIINAKWLAEVLAKRKTDVKAVLMNQKIIRGIGNSYADEILYHAGISPFSTANAIPKKAVSTLATSIKKVLTEEIENIKKKYPDGLTGEVRDFMKIHLPKTDKTLKGEAIIVDKTGSRKTYYVASQRLYK